MSHQRLLGRYRQLGQTRDIAVLLAFEQVRAAMPSYHVLVAEAAVHGS